MIGSHCELGFVLGVLNEKSGTLRVIVVCFDIAHLILGTEWRPLCANRAMNRAKGGAAKT